MYLGELETNHSPNSYPAEHPALIPKELFDSVQAHLANKAAASGYRQSRSEALLIGKLFDDRDHRMTPSHAVKGGVRYRYYVSRAIMEGRQTEAGAIARVPAEDVERVVVDAIAGLSGPATGRCDDIADDRHERRWVQEFVERITIRAGAIEIALTGEAAAIAGRGSIVAPWSTGANPCSARNHRPGRGAMADPARDKS